MTGARESFLNDLARGLTERKDNDLLRQPASMDGIDFHSNDYLGLARDAEVAALSIKDTQEMGAGGARLLAGHRRETQTLEDRFAKHVGRQASLLFSSGFSANVGIIPALVGEGDSIFSDALNHASLIDGMRLSKAEIHVFPHRDMDALRSLLRQASGNRRMIVTESLFSMDGHRAYLSKLAAVAEEEGALLLVDEAHATGVFGHQGAGLVAAAGLQDSVLLTLHTGGKAMGSAGALVAADQVVIDHLTNHCRSFIYSTAPQPVLVQSLSTALDILQNDPDRQLRLIEAIAHLSNGLAELGFSDHDEDSPILPLIVGAPDRALAISAALMETGFAARAVRPPTVPVNSARLRITAHADVGPAERSAFLESLQRILKRNPCTASS